jgi:hypothetical protein
MPTWRCRHGIHTAQRSRGVVGYCLRDCGDLKRVQVGSGGWIRYTVKPSDDRRPSGPPPVAQPYPDIFYVEGGI